MRLFFVLFMVSFTLFFAACNNNSTETDNNKANAQSVSPQSIASQQQNIIANNKTEIEQPDTTGSFPFILEYNAEKTPKSIPVSILKTKPQQINQYFNTASSPTQVFNAYVFDEDTVRQVTLNIFPIIETNGGIVYDFVLEVDLNKKVEVPVERLNLGFFYVQKARILKFAPTKENYQSLKNNILSSNNVVVAQNISTEDTRGKGFHQFVELADDSCTFHGYNNSIETGWFERIVWKKNKGIVKYFSGYGAGGDIISLALPPGQPEE